MKKLAIVTGILCAAAFATTTTAHAAGRTGFIVPVETEVNGVKLEPGIYRLNWQGQGSDVRLSFVHGGEVKATVNARLHVSDETVHNDTMIVTSGAGGSGSVRELRLADANLFITLSDGEAKVSSLSPAKPYSGKTAIQVAEVRR